MAFDQDMSGSGVVTQLEKRGISVPGPSILFPIAGIVVSELLLFFGFTYYALGAHFLTLAACVFAPLRYETDSALLQVFALVPVFRLVNLGMPVFFELTVYWFPLIYGPLIPAIYIAGRSNHLISISPGWKVALLALPIAIPVSAGLGMIEYLILRPAALIPAFDLLNLLVIAAVMLLFVGFVEELLFRGVLQQALVPEIGRWPAIIVASALFGLMHSGYQVPAELLFAGTIGFVFGVIYDRTDSIVLITIMHGLLNVFLFALIPMNSQVLDAVNALV